MLLLIRLFSYNKHYETIYSLFHAITYDLLMEHLRLNPFPT